jgi:Zn-dependent peptidase ImmA (M78 family)
VFARQRRQLNQTELARRAELVARTVQRYEHGQEAPSQEALRRLAAVLAFPPEFFLDDRPLPEIPEFALSFRAYSKLKARLRNNAIAVAQLSVQIADYLSELYDFPELSVPDLRESASSPKDAARILRDEWALGHGPIPNVVDVLESHGVRVFSLAEDVADVDAFCFWKDREAFIVLNLLKSAERGRFDGAHELGHLVLHRQIDFRGKDVEREADAFAAEFLVPEESLLRQLPKFVTIDTVKKLKRHWRVSAMAMVKRLKDIGRLSDWVYRSMCMQLSRAGYRSSEKDGVEGETSSLLADIFSSGADGIAVGDVAKRLRVSAADISPLVFGLPAARGHLRLVRGGTPSGAVGRES